MEEKNNPKGFIQIPILIAIIVGILAISGGSYFGYTKLKISQDMNIGEVINPPTTQEEITRLQQQIDELTKQAGQNTKIEALQKEITSLKAQQTKSSLTNAEIIAKVKPAVVYIKTGDGSSGSGMIIESDGFILTNAHVVGGANLVNITMSDKKLFMASVIGRNGDIDLALLKIIGNGFPVVELGDSGEDILKQGDEVFTLGYPFSLEGDVSFKEGTISRRLSDEGITYLETSAEIHPGNSGGPLVNKFGQVVGINTLIFGRSIKGVLIGETIKFAIPINTAKAYITELKTGGSNISSSPNSPLEKIACERSSNFPWHYYSDGNYYKDEKCSVAIQCLLYSDQIHYYDYKKQLLYHDSDCTQQYVKGCNESKIYTFPKRFYKTGSWYMDSGCTQVYKACTFPPTSGYTCTERSDFNYNLSNCDYYRMYKWSSYAHYCEELPECESDINNYQKKMNEYNQCLDDRKKEN